MNGVALHRDFLVLVRPSDRLVKNHLTVTGNEHHRARRSALVDVGLQPSRDGLQFLRVEPRTR